MSLIFTWLKREIVFYYTFQRSHTCRNQSNKLLFISFKNIINDSGLVLKFI